MIKYINYKTNKLKTVKKFWRKKMIYSTEIENMCPVKKGANHGPAPIPEEGKWVKAEGNK